jgi:hypothetical protein
MAGYTQNCTDVLLNTTPGGSRIWSTSCTNGEYLLTGGGQDLEGNFLGDFHLYHIPSNTWQMIEPYPAGARTGMYSFCIGDRFFAGGGGAGILGLGTMELFEFQLTELEWQARSSTPLEVKHAPVAVVNGIGYLIPAGQSLSAEIIRYLPDEDTWETVTTFPSSFDVPNPQEYCQTMVFGETIFFGNGVGFNSQGGSEVYRKWYKLDTQTNEVTQLQDIPWVVDFDCLAFQTESCGFLLTDESSGSALVAYQYDPTNDSWTIAPCPFANFTFDIPHPSSAATANGTGYFMYGTYTTGTESFNQIFSITAECESTVSIHTHGPASPAAISSVENGFAVEITRSGIYTIIAHDLMGRELLQKTLSANDLPASNTYLVQTTGLFVVSIIDQLTGQFILQQRLVH